MNDLIALERYQQRSDTPNSLDEIDRRLRADTSALHDPDTPPDYANATRNKDLPPDPSLTGDAPTATWSEALPTGRASRRRFSDLAQSPIARRDGATARYRAIVTSP